MRRDSWLHACLFVIDCCWVTLCSVGGWMRLVFFQVDLFLVNKPMIDNE